MIKSMTGFGNNICSYENTIISVEIKAINSKIFDLLQKSPLTLKEKELDIRTIVSKILERGKIELTITVDEGQNILDFTIDKNKVKAYYKELKNIVSELDIQLNEPENLLTAILKMPEVITNPKNDILPELWLELKQAIIIACELLDASRIEEGKTIEKDFLTRILLIQDYLQQVETFETQRIDALKNRITKNLTEVIQQYDENRFVQELIFYLEKFDITEEKIRLKTHCDYFLETLKENVSNGKKLSFISQEIGREINTLGSKACDADIQKLVVQMKDELEKIKEQLSNVL
jgi:uncharacterized protein (TIGR00255 family)